ncbi:hypothetical protein EUTSA_v10002176mg [Eutrema salsugineum]|uniref:Defensin-like protein n=1 Tax=Eutrema salsugineum TaxID=72664 RepID=V4M2I6_EUTSA|nr:hypothetical protein EUTSA_v10002176mg [Eutrema salsugineum]
MAKTAFTLVLPIIFLVMFALVKENMGCSTTIGPCEVGKNCSPKCWHRFGDFASGYCDRSSGRPGVCVCIYPCTPPLDAHMQ